MRSKYFWFNLMCFSLSAFFLVVSVLLYFQTYKPSQIITFEINSDNNKKTGDTKVVPEQVKVGKDSSTTISTSSMFAQNDDMTELPKTYSLAVPFTSQAPEKNWDQPWQDACEEAALLMMDAYYKKYNLSPLFAKDEILKMVDWETEHGMGYDIDAEQFKIMGKDYFKFNFKIIENPSVEDIKKLIAGGQAVLGVFDGKVLPNPHFRSGGPVYHALVIKGYDEENFITNDPGTQFGEGFKYKYDDLVNALHDWNGGDVKNGRKVIMVIE
jgi:hypothetical protein